MVLMPCISSPAIRYFFHMVFFVVLEGSNFRSVCEYPGTLPGNSKAVSSARL